jgi:hypothetical protein
LESTECSAYPACSALDGECCPTIDNVILDCCFSIAVLTPAPFAGEADSAAPSSEVEDTTAPGDLSVLDSAAPSSEAEDTTAPGDLPVLDSAAPSSEAEDTTAPSDQSVSAPAPSEVEDTTAPSDLPVSTPAPSAAEDDSAASSPEVEDTTAPSDLPVSTPAPSPAEEETSSAPSPELEDPIAPSDLPVSTPGPSPAEEETSSAPTETATTVPGPPQSTPPADSLVSITPLEYEGCIEDEDNVSIDKIFLRTCDSTKLAQKFTYDGAFMRTGSNEDKCLQAGYNGDPAEGEFVRVVDCDSNNLLQKFTWDFANSGFIMLTDKPDFCMSFRGVNDNVGADPILMKECEMNDFEGTKFFKWGVKA